MATYSKPRPEVILRAATKADASTLLRLIRRYYAFDHIVFEPRAIRTGLLKLFKNPSAGRAFLVLRRTKPVGYTILTYGFDLEFGGRTALMTDLYLEPAYRGCGIGTKTMEFLERFCRKRGIKELELQLERTNVWARAFYKRCGFRAHDRIPMSKRITKNDKMHRR